MKMLSNYRVNIRVSLLNSNSYCQSKSSDLFIIDERKTLSRCYIW